MKNIVIKVLLCVLICLSTAVARNMQVTTPRTQITPIGLTIKRSPAHTKNISTVDIITDIRTPPKVKQMFKKAEQMTEQTGEYSHPGVAEPLDTDIDALEETMKKLSFYKLERPTTDSGLSTWILLSGQSLSSSTIATTKSPLPMLNKDRGQSKKNVTSPTTNSDHTNKPPVSTVNKDRNNTKSNSSAIISNPDRVNKPIFKKRPTTASTAKTTAETTTRKSTFTTSAMVVPVSTISPERTTKLKSPTSNNGTNIKNASLITLSSLKSNTSGNNAIKKDENKVIMVTASLNTTTSVKMPSTTELVPESKVGDLELHSSTTTNPKKTRRPTNKKKKDKNRRKRPSADVKSNSQNKTKIANKVSQKDKPITTQIYNYLAREVMPTVGVGLVGLVVTAGLASYFLYPFGSLRRSYDVDRYDKGYTSYYGGAIAEEEAIGKVIAGMSTISDTHNTYRQPNYRNGYVNNRYRHVENTYSNKAPVQAAHRNPNSNYNINGYNHDIQYSNEISKNEPITYSKNVVSPNVETSYTNNDQQFVVGNIPKEIIEEITPAAVPEHGPRSLKIRKRRNVEDEISNEIEVDNPPQKFNEKSEDEGNVIANNTLVSSDLKQQIYNFIDFLAKLFTSKLRIGLEILQGHARAISQYINTFQKKLDQLDYNNAKNK